MTVLSFGGPGLTKGLLQFGLRQFGEVLQRMRWPRGTQGSFIFFHFFLHSSLQHFNVGFEDVQLGDDCGACCYAFPVFKPDSAYNALVGLGSFGSPLHFSTHGAKYGV